ncbi:pyridoxal 5'-phosphate synthase subunit PdxT-like isoform X3 [Clavelina lepadiformis]|uniref:pyridoxal 5'-phosphate synthase subunit PdxT-like isoform X3 n=1 Tax=Clavelina lepadiformis TaxID=159417 RepID=UPI004041B497
MRLAVKFEAETLTPSNLNHVRHHCVLVTSCPHFASYAIKSHDYKLNDNLNGLIIPGGESTVMKRHFENGFLENLKDWTRLKNKFTWGTCAGLILLSNQMDGGNSELQIGGVDITCSRNAYGRQINSFESPLHLLDSQLQNIAGNNTCLGIFIRAPKIKSVDSQSVNVLCHLSAASHENNAVDEPVAVCQENIMVSTFHPELSGDTCWHEYFILQAAVRKSFQA